MNRDNCLLTVVIPTNRIQYLDEAIDSVLSQTQECEILVVDDGSEIPIKTQIKNKYPSVRFMRHKRNMGLPASRNTGVKNARTKYISFLDCDDLLKPDFAKEMINACRKLNVRAVVCLPHYFFSPGFPLKRKIVFSILSAIRDLLLLASFLLNKRRLPKDGFFLVQSSHVIFERELLCQFPSDITYLTAANDWKLMGEILAKEKVGILLKRLSFYRYHYQSQSQSKNKIDKWQYYEKLLEETPEVCQKGLLIGLFRLYNHFGKKFI